MSFLDLATVSFRRRQELESRISTFVGKCDLTIAYLQKLKEQARGVAHNLNCDPSEFKEQYMKCVMQLEEYIYMITDMNLALVTKLGEELAAECECIEEDSTSPPCLTPTIVSQPVHLMNGSRKPVPSTSSPRPVEKDKPRKHKKLSREDTLIMFSSFSSSNESFGKKSAPNQSHILNDEHCDSSHSTSLGVTYLSSQSQAQATATSNCSSSSSPAFNNVEKDVQCVLENPASSMTEHLDCNVRNASYIVEKEVQCQVTSFDEPAFSTEDNHKNANNKVEKYVQCEDTNLEEADEPVHNMQEIYENGDNKVEKEDQDLGEAADIGSNSDTEENQFPQQSTLKENSVYGAAIITMDFTHFWVVLQPVEEVQEFIEVMSRYYDDPLIQAKSLDEKELYQLTYCAYFDVVDTQFWYRGMIIDYNQDEGKVNVFLVDTGETRDGDVSAIRPLAEAFFERPPYARCCHLAGVELIDSEETQQEVSDFLQEHNGTLCSIKIDDVFSESLGVYVTLPDGQSLGDVMVKRGLAHWEEPPHLLSSTPNVGSSKLHEVTDNGETNNLDTENIEMHNEDTTQTTGPPEMCPSSTSELELLNMDCPEYEDPLLAVAGYSNRDEADICKHYKGGPDKTCFKGARCTKKHIMHHPDGWTLDKVEVVGKIESLPLPAPDTWLRVVVTCVNHFDSFYVQIVRDSHPVRGNPTFGVLRPPTSLEELVRDMNSLVQKMDYKPYTIAPALGELVAAIYPMDGMYYRARVIEREPANVHVKVDFIDYGNKLLIREDKVFSLPVQYAVLPSQAIMCRLAGVAAKRPADSRLWANANKVLTDLTLQKTLDAHVISARDYDEITVVLIDERGVDIAQELSRLNLVDLLPFKVIDDTNVMHRIIVP